MNEVSKQAIVPYSKAEMYYLVNDVRHYPNFLPGCTGVEVHSESNAEMDVSMMLSKAGLNLSLRTVNTLLPEQKIIMRLKTGPFKMLHGEWCFDDLGENACKVNLTLQYQMESGMISRILGHYFSSLAETMMSAFEQRAKAVYGKR